MYPTLNFTPFLFDLNGVVSLMFSLTKITWTKFSPILELIYAREIGENHQKLLNSRKITLCWNLHVATWIFWWPLVLFLLAKSFFRGRLGSFLFPFWVKVEFRTENCMFLVNFWRFKMFLVDFSEFRVFYVIFDEPK